jgi:hypothetical protein
MSAPEDIVNDLESNPEAGIGGGAAAAPAGQPPTPVA